MTLQQSVQVPQRLPSLAAVATSIHSPRETIRARLPLYAMVTLRDGERLRVWRQVSVCSSRLDRAILNIATDLVERMIVYVILVFLVLPFLDAI